MMNFEGVRIAITPGPSDPVQTVAIMQFLTVGRGDRLPYGGRWIDEMGLFTEDPATGWWRREPSEENIFACVLKSFRGGGRPLPAKWERINEADIPADRTYRSALVIEDGKLKHDMVMAREIHRNMLRDARAPELTALDIAYQRADEEGDANAKAEIALQKKALRDITADPAIEAAATTEDLKRVTLGLLAFDVKVEPTTMVGVKG